MVTEKQKIHDKNWSKKDISLKINDSNASIISILPSFSCALDVGCGTGELMLFLKKKGAKIRGVDISSKALSVAKKRGLNVKKVDLDEGLEFSSNSFDLVICNQVLMHVFNPSFIISEMKRVSKKYVLINVPNHLYWRIRLKMLFGSLPDILSSPAAHIRLFNYFQIRSMIDKNDLRIVSESFTGKSLFPSMLATGFTFLCEKK